MTRAATSGDARRLPLTVPQDAPCKQQGGGSWAQSGSIQATSRRLYHTHHVRTCRCAPLDAASRVTAGAPFPFNWLTLPTEGAETGATFAANVERRRGSELTTRRLLLRNNTRGYFDLFESSGTRCQAAQRGAIPGLAGPRWRAHPGGRRRALHLPLAPPRGTASTAKVGDLRPQPKIWLPGLEGSRLSQQAARLNEPRSVQGIRQSCWVKKDTVPEIGRLIARSKHASGHHPGQRAAALRRR